MRLHRISLQQYRNYASLDVEFDVSKNINIIVGGNGQGKTNLLESIALLSLAKSFRSSKSDRLIKEHTDFTRIVGEIKSDKHDVNLEYFVSTAPTKKKNLRKNGADIPVKDFIGELNIVLFHPDDLNMLTLSPALRRKYINTVLSQTDPFYFDSLVHYNRAVKQRNKLLFLVEIGKAQKEQLEVWDDKLAEYGVYITKKRKDFVDFMNDLVEKNYNNIADAKDKVKLKYIRSLDMDEPTQAAYLAQLKASEAKDLKYGKTSRGVHRDDIHFIFNGNHISEFGSRGEMRTLIISLKLAEIDYIEKQTGKKPILLLDDVFSELDLGRQQFLLNRIRKHQSIITTTHSDFTLEDAKIYKIQDGEVVT